MAITIEQQPQTYSTVYNNLPFVVSSDNTTEAGFQYVFDVWVSGSFLTRHRIPARPGTGVGVFDPRKVLESLVTHDIDYAVNNWSNCPNSIIDYQIKYGEEYVDSGVTTVFDDLEDSGTLFVFNASLEYLEWLEFDYTDYDLSEVSTSTKFLTNAPNIQNVILGQKAWLHMLASDPLQTIGETIGDKGAYQVKTYSAAGTLINTSVAYTSDITGITGDMIERIGIGPAQLLEQFGGSFLNGASYYTVAVLSGGLSPTRITELRRFNIDSACRYTPVRLHFLNKLGGFDAFNFKKASKNNTDINRKTYKKLLGTQSGTSFTYSSSDRVVNNMSISTDDSVKITSDWLSEEESFWLKELVSSPIVFQELNGQLIPVQITDTKYEQKKKDTEKIFNLELTFNYSVTNYRQRY